LLKFNTSSSGPIEIEIICRDTNVQESFESNSELYEGYDGCIIMVERMLLHTYTTAPNWKNRNFTGGDHKDFPVVVCGNKADIQDSKVKTDETSFRDNLQLTYIPTSVLSSQNLVLPFLCLLRKLLKDTTVHFVNTVPDPILTTHKSEMIFKDVTVRLTRHKSKSMDIDRGEIRLTVSLLKDRLLFVGKQKFTTLFEHHYYFLH
jgi:GTPase SAR1 family protein